jgi:hypothetical protein
MTNAQNVGNDTYTRSMVMTTTDLIILIFCYVDDRMQDVGKHPQAKLYGSELVTIGVLYALKGGSFRAFYRWLKRDYAALFGGLPDRTRLRRALKVHPHWFNRLLADPSFFTVMDTYPIELLFPIREGRSSAQIGKKGRDKGRWSIGIKLAWLLNERGEVVAWQWNTLNTADKHFNSLAIPLIGQTIVLADYGARDVDGVPENIKICPKGTWNERMLVETGFSMLTLVAHLKHIFERAIPYIQSRLAATMAMFNVLLALFHQLHPEADPFQMSIAEFSL